ncbi:aldehyde dehydrogenase family protein [Conexibacter sp. SYSU D00693]|uniref:aldehyde dehydrogenase family protein n=1 Tax=Conexibacter sp. SYSU D00693 TaxID=2812560 RepID=UPI00196A7BB7|nr:aldehyde dehydrogenase family protein [Conexibacter sp. SYSU D00693]
MSTQKPVEVATQERAGRTITVRCPADGRVVAEVKDHTPDEVGAIAQELRLAQPAWAASGFDERARWLGRWRDWVLDHQERLLELLQQEAGKSYGDASIEILAAVEVINYYVGHGKDFLADEHPRPAGLANQVKRLRVRHHPHQLVGVITPWNYPLAMPFMDVPQALLAGCAVLSKPSEETPLAWQEAVRGWQEDLGAPNVLACTTGLGPTGASVVDTVDMVQFTGSTATGRKIGARCGERLIPASLELGGKDPMIVLADADLERAANGAIWGGFFNGGQSCTAVERVFVEAPVYDRFVALVVEKARALRQGMDTPGSYATDFGAIANEKQVQLIDRHVQEAVARGARAVTGGRRGEHCNYPATVLLDVDTGMACMQEETFGPTLPIMRVADVDEAVDRANETDYGLSASVWTKDAAKAEWVADRLQAGAVNHNDAMMNVFQFPVPHGGWRSSGVGSRFGGAGGIRKYTHPQVYVTARVEPKTEMHWYPHTRRKGRLTAVMLPLIAARDWRRRLGLKARS